MPKSKKRKKTQDVQEIKSSNPMKRWWGKAIVFFLASAFVLSIVIGLVYNAIQIMK